MKFFFKIILAVMLCHLNMWFIMKSFGTRHVYGTISDIGPVTRSWYGTYSYDVTLSYPDGGSETFREGSSLFFGKDDDDYTRESAFLRFDSIDKEVCLYVNGFGNIIHVVDLTKHEPPAEPEKEVVEND